MLTSFKRLPWLARAGLAATLVLPLSGTPAAAATIVATAHYQFPLTLTCGAQDCSGYFPAVTAKRRLNLERVTCHLHSAQYGAYASGKISLRTAGNVTSTVQFLPADYSTQWGFHLINSAVDVQVVAGLQFGVVLSMAPGSGNAYDAACTAHGTLEFLQ
jgi:hypothetical protein